jgi:hypothetical protein
MPRRSTPPQTPLWIGCGLALLGIAHSVLASRSQRQTLREQSLLLSQAQKLLSSKDAMTFQALSLPEQQPEPDLGIDPGMTFPPMSGPEAYFNDVDPFTAGALADAAG